MRLASRAPPAAAPVWWSVAAAESMRRLDTRAEGLAQAQADERLRLHGANEIEDRAAFGMLRVAVRQIANPLVAILVFGAVVSAFLRNWTDASIIVVIVAGSAILGFAQEYRASTAIEQLRQRLALTVRALRDGRPKTVPAREIVPGDVIELAAGSLVPADGIVLAARDFLVTEASLTGEPFPVEKRPGVVEPQAPLAARTNCVFLGSSVRSGTASVLVVRTGRDTQFGGIASRLRRRDPETAFDRGLRHFGYLLVRVMLVMVAFVLVVNHVLGRPPIDSLMFAMALAVGLSPELLPAIVAVTLSHGARQMATKGVIVRRLQAIENLGGIDVLCTDKTGTLTRGRVSLEGATDAQGRPSEAVRRLAWLNATLETGIENPLDAAIVEDATHGGGAGAVRKIDEIPYDFIRRRLTIVVADENGEYRMVTKGAFEEVLAACSTVAAAEGEEPLDESRRERLRGWFRERGDEGLRVLAVATRRVEARAHFERGDERELSLAGFLLFSDPARAQATQTIAQLRSLGIGVRMITGDNRHVAAHVGRAIGLDADSLATGGEIDALSDDALRVRAERTVIFAEIDPQQKERIVRALRRGGHSVGYLGDGINDAPALHAADVGVSVEGAVDVARESADVVMTRADLAVLREGVEEGRRAFANTLKYIEMTTSANFGNMVSMAVASPLLPFLPMAAKQILLNNFLSDIPSVAVATDNVDPPSHAGAPRWSMTEVRRFMVVFGLASSAFDLLTFFVLLRVFRADEPTFQTAWFVVSLLTEIVVVLVLRTPGPALRGRPGRLLLAATAAVAALAIAIPSIGPLARAFDFVALSGPLLASSVAIVLAYVLCTEALKLRMARIRVARAASRI